MAKKTQMNDSNIEYNNIYNDFYNEYKKQLGEISLPFNFNILDTQSGTIKENSHTNILMKLLEYKNQYGYVFLEDFIKLADFNIEINKNQPVAFETEYFDAVPVEKRANKKMQGRIDGLIYQKENFAIIIENKINGATNQDVQLERYIESVVGNGNRECLAKNDNVYVVFLTKDSVGDPDNKSIEFMRNNGILNQPESGSQSDSIAGPRYFACSYRHDILPWLENGVQPLVFYKELILNTGLVQYIDFLKGMLGERDGKNALWIKCKEWFEKNETIKNVLNGNLQEQNSFLYDFYKYLKALDIDNSDTTDDEKKKQTDCINLLQSIVCEKAEKPMAEFMRVTKEFFTAGDNPLIQDKDYIVSHPSNFAYINIRSRDKKWPKGFMVGWFPTVFFSSSPSASLFIRIPQKYTNIINQPEPSKFKKQVQQKDCTVWRMERKLSDSQINEVNEDALVTLYEDSGIAEIIRALKESNKD